MERYEEWMNDDKSWPKHVPDNAKFYLFRWYILRNKENFKDSPREQFADFMSALVFQKETGWN